MRLGLLGGTGIEAKGLALRFAAAGAAVVLGSRSRLRAAQAAENCNAILSRPLIRGMSNEEMLEASEIVFLATPFANAVEAVESLRSSLQAHHVIVDVTVPLIFRGGRPEFVDQQGLSNAEVIARHLAEGVPLVAAFKTIPAAILANLKTALDCDVLICSDNEAAKHRVINASALISSLRPLDGGSLQTARTLERMAVLAAELNARYRHKGARYRIVGI